ncbi:FHA domain-containing protein [Nocardia arthritidis]|uniref:FHA domain-containing protein n=1 Tax=Nocardia arthritidis TaxID=228602 RepID=A0A6G9YLH1_9NOCA|nr:FHA domain-containing protein [Nocardia arthritidis]QIS14145.1 FHA domain-containing protein [Nocardia arthritidis]
MSEFRQLAGNDSGLAFGVPDSAPHTIYVLALTGGVATGPAPGRRIRFGRNRPEVDVCVGGDDRKISRCQGLLTHHENRWWVRNLGRQPLRLPGSRMLFGGEDPLPLDTGYTPMFIRGSGRREHLLELYVTGADTSRTGVGPADPTDPPRTWRFSDTERLVLIVLAQRYLLQEAYPQPMAWSQAAIHLDDLQPDAGWTAKRVEHVVEKVRARLSAKGVAGLTREEVGEPVGNTLNHNLIRELIDSTTLIPPDLRLLEFRDE